MTPTSGSEYLLFSDMGFLSGFHGSNFGKMTFAGQDRLSYHFQRLGLSEFEHLAAIGPKTLGLRRLSSLPYDVCTFRG
jgi:hypothetical protein